MGMPSSLSHKQLVHRLQSLEKSLGTRTSELEEEKLQKTLLAAKLDEKVAENQELARKASQLKAQEFLITQSEHQQQLLIKEKRMKEEKAKADQEPYTEAIPVSPAGSRKLPPTESVYEPIDEAGTASPATPSTPSTPSLATPPVAGATPAARRAASSNGIVRSASSNALPHSPAPIIGKPRTAMPPLPTGHARRTSTSSTSSMASTASTVSTADRKAKPKASASGAVSPLKKSASSSKLRMILLRVLRSFVSHSFIW